MRARLVIAVKQGTYWEPRLRHVNLEKSTIRLWSGAPERFWRYMQIISPIREYKWIGKIYEML